MAILNPEHLLDQAERLIERRGAGAPRRVDLRRAISNAYYGVFHAVTAAAADAFVGRGRRVGPQYSLAYRSIDHRYLRQICDEVRRPTLRDRSKPYGPPQGFAPDMIAFVELLLELQQKRHAADYDPALRFSSSEARLSIGTARDALRHWRDVPDAERTVFVALLLFPPR